MNVSKTTLTLAMTVALGAAGSVNASQSQNPFGMQHLQSGYIQVAEAKSQDGKCGANSETKAKDGKCASNATETKKAKDGKCGEGKCAANKKEEKVKQASCGENKG